MNYSYPHRTRIFDIRILNIIPCCLTLPSKCFAFVHVFLIERILPAKFKYFFNQEYFVLLIILKLLLLIPIQQLRTQSIVAFPYTFAPEQYRLLLNLASMFEAVL